MEVMNHTLNHFVEGGAGVSIHFHRCIDLQTAYDKLKPYTKLGSIEKESVDGYVWLSIESEEKNIRITAFL